MMASSETALPTWQEQASQLDDVEIPYAKQSSTWTRWRNTKCEICQYQAQLFAQLFAPFTALHGHLLIDSTRPLTNCLPLPRYATSLSELMPGKIRI